MGSFRGTKSLVTLVVALVVLPATAFSQNSVPRNSQINSSVPVIVKSEPSVPDAAEKLAQVLKFVFDNEALKHGWPANYTALWCPTNVFNLLRRLNEAKVDLSNAQVIYILPSYNAIHKGESEIRPRAARTGRDGPIREWTFHVILKVGEKILDLDFTNDPVIVDTNEYFARMFGKGPLATQKSKQPLYFRSIPASDYLASYSGNWEWYLAGAGGRFEASELDTLFPDLRLATSVVTSPNH